MTTSLADYIYAGLRAKLVRAELMPGMLLSENELAAEFGMSRTPVRTALSRLETEGFVVSLKNRGILVKELSGKEVLDMFETIAGMQAFTAETVAQRGGGFNIPALEQMLEQQRVATGRGDYAAHMEHSLAFTTIYLAASNNNFMLKIMEECRDKLMMAAIVNFKRTPHQEHFSSDAVNERMMELIKAGDYGALRQAALDSYAAVRERAFRAGHF
ncbi:GntR family transcriptional regulator [Paenibacillus methanolicus]|uniref:DNA-binding GntR family transcriptional regulator n=1 Tax=Paenibacillus methanolicus TaxID=582686 RepID=A0A5S5C8K7_9BACL|nr:GntR family transcriptional regulator [Paenibacillus methanolicus]TYP75519.1 DNA-binding GntR family transcriptional regulator [Paenibacillus methanolicus]